MLCLSFISFNIVLAFVMTNDAVKIIILILGTKQKILKSTA